MVKARTFAVGLLSCACLLSPLNAQAIRAQETTGSVESNGRMAGDGKAAQIKDKSRPQPLFSLPVGGNSPGVQFSPNSQYIATWTANVFTGFLFGVTSQSDLRIYELATGQECFRFSGKFDRCDFSPNSERVAICDGDSVTVWEIADGSQLANLRFETPVSARFSREGEVLVTFPFNPYAAPVPDQTSARPSKLQLWDTRSWSEIPCTSDKFSSGSAHIPAITPDARFAATLVWNEKAGIHSLKIWELGTGVEMPVPNIAKPVDVQPADDARAFRIRSQNDLEWFEWNFETKQLIVCSEPTDNLFAKGYHRPKRSADTVARVELIDGLWQVTRHNQKTTSFPNPTKWHPSTVNFKSLLGDDQLLLAQEERVGEINVWSLDQPDRTRTIPVENPVWDLSLAGDDRTLAVLTSASNNKVVPSPAVSSVVLVDLQQEFQPTILTQGPLLDIDFADQSHKLAIVSPEKVEIWDTAKRTLDSVHHTTEQTDNLIPKNGLAKFANSAHAIFIATGNWVELRTIADDRVLWKTAVGKVSELEASEDGKYLAVSTDSFTNSQKLFVLSASDGRVLAAAPTDQPADLFHFWSPKPTLTVVRREEGITHVDLASKFTIPAHPTGTGNSFNGRMAFDFAACALTRQYAVAGAVEGYSEHPGEVRIRDLVSGRLLFKLTATTGKINCASFFSNGRQLVGGGESRIRRTMEVLDLSQEKVIFTIRGELFCASSRNGQLLLTRDSIDDSRLTLWIPGKERRQVVLSHPHARHAVFSPNSEALVTVGEGGAMIWSVPQLLNEAKGKSN